MSITFSLTRLDDNGVYVHGCAIDHRADGCSGTCSDPIDFIHYGHCECTEAASAACADCTLDVNVSNTNAMAILDRLGVEFDYCGVIDPADLFARAVVGNIGRDDSGISVTETSGSGATMIDCGVRPGYYADRLGALEGLASVAMERGLLIGWA